MSGLVVCPHCNVRVHLSTKPIESAASEKVVPTRPRKTSAVRRRQYMIWNAYSHIASVVGAISLANIVREVVEFKQIIRDFLDAWTNVVKPIADFLFGWVAVVWDWLRIPVELPFWYKDYLIIGLVVSTAIARGALVAGASDLSGKNRLIREAYGMLRSRDGEKSPEFNQVLEELREADPSAASALEVDVARRVRGSLMVQDAERRQLGSAAPEAGSLLALAIFGLPIWPLSFLTSVSVVADVEAIDTVDYFVTSSLFLLYFFVIVMVNYAWFFAT